MSRHRPETNRSELQRAEKALLEARTERRTAEAQVGFLARLREGWQNTGLGVAIADRERQART